MVGWLTRAAGIVLGGVELAAGGALAPLVVIVSLAAGRVACTTLGVVFCSAGLTEDDGFTPDTGGFFFTAPGPRKLWYTPAPISIISTGRSASPIALQNGGIHAPSGTTAISFKTGIDVVIRVRSSAKSTVAHPDDVMQVDSEGRGYSGARCGFRSEWPVISKSVATYFS
jgi:hypothetical protein